MIENRYEQLAAMKGGAMQKLIRTGSFLCSLTLFCVVATFVALPAMVWEKAKEALGRQSARYTRRMVTRLQVEWGSWLFERVCHRMRIELDLDMHLDKTSRGPFIVVMNHTSMFDVLIVLKVMAVYKRFDLRWIIKREMMYAPVLGRMARWSGNGFVDRNGNPADRDAVSACAEVAREDDSSVVIFAEGTRSFYKLLPPKPGGFNRLRKALPHHSGLLVTVAWDPVTKNGGRTLSEGARLFGKRLFISTRVVEPERLTPIDFLQRHWEWRRDLIAAWRKRRYFKRMLQSPA